MEQFLYIILIPKISKNLCHRYYFFPSLYRNNLSIEQSPSPLTTATQLERKRTSRKIRLEFSKKFSVPRRNRSPQQQGCNQRNKSLPSAFHGGAALRPGPGQLIPLVQVVHQVRRSNVYTSRQRRLTNTPRLSFLSPRIPRGVSSDPNPVSCH